MLFGGLTEAQQEKLFELLELFFGNGEPPIDYLYKDRLNEIQLSWFQSFAIQHSLITKSTLISLATGLGKTMTAIALIDIVLRDISKGTKFMFFCIPTSVDQVRNDFSKYCDLKVLSCTGARDSIFNLVNTPITFVDGYVISMEALYSLEFCNWLATNKDFFSIIVIDEAHLVTLDSQIRDICVQLRNYCTYMCALTATPLTTDPKQALDLVNMLDRKVISNSRRFLEPYEVRDDITFELKGYEGLDDVSDDLFPHYVTFNRKDLNMDGKINSMIYFTQPNDEQRNCSRSESFELIKLPKDGDQARVLQALVNDKVRRGLRGIVYCRHLAVASMVQELLADINIPANKVNSENTEDEKRRFIPEFNRGVNSVLITSTTTSLNISCDFIIVYEQTVHLSQLLGRAQRGFMPKDIEVDFILMEDTVEIDQFYDNVYKPQVYLRDMLGKDIDVAERINKALIKRNLI